MKSQFQSRALTGVLFAVVITVSPLVAQTAATAPVTPTPTPETRVVAVPMNVMGKVEAKSDTTLTVAGRTVSINGGTTFSRKGASIGSGDIKVGDKVNVVTTDSGQVAVSVDVIASE